MPKLPSAQDARVLSAVEKVLENCEKKRKDEGCSTLHRKGFLDKGGRAERSHVWKLRMEGGDVVSNPPSHLLDSSDYDTEDFTNGSTEGRMHI